jgi:hypothetical protein
MRTKTLAVATVLAAAALSVQAQTRMEPIASPFTYEAVGATPSLNLGRARNAAKAPEAPKAAPKAATGTAPRAAGTAVTPFTYDTLGATPHVEARKTPKAEVLAPSSAH